MFGAALQKMLIGLGLKKAPSAPDPSPGAENDFVARHGRSYGNAADPLSDEARFELERLKSLPRSRR
jgi:hypothetical protein